MLLRFLTIVAAIILFCADSAINASLILNKNQSSCGRLTTGSQNSVGTESTPRTYFQRYSNPTGLDTPSSQSDFEGVHYKVGLWNCSRAETVLATFYRKVFDEIAHFYNLSYSVVNMCVNMETIYENINSGKLDVVCDLSKTPERQKRLKFFKPFYEQSYAFIIKMPKGTWHRFQITAPFSSLTWIFIFVYGFVMIFLLGMLQNRSRDMHDTSYTDIFIYVFGTVTNRGGTYRNDSTVVRVLQGCWWMFVIVTVAIYTGIIVSYLSVFVTVNYPFTTVKEAADGRMIPVVMEQFSGTDLMKNSNPDSDFGKMWKKVSRDPRATVSEHEDAMELVLTGNYYFIVGTTFGRILVATENEFFGECKVELAPVQFLPTAVTCATSYSFQNFHALDVMIQYLAQNGILHKMEQELELQTKDCLNHLPKAVVQTGAITPEYLWSVFGFLLCGIGAGVLCLFVEKTIHTYFYIF